jgi:hypothetical protein
MRGVLSSRGPSPAPAPGAGLTPEQLRQLAEARRLSAKIRRAVTYAYFDFVGLAGFALLTLAGSAFSFSWPGFLLGIAMAVVALVEFRGARDLSRLDERAPQRLALNQICLGAALFLYAMFSLWWGLRHPEYFSGLLASQMPPDVGGSSMVASINDLTRTIVTALYGALAAVAIFVQGGTALFYLSRQAYLRRYLATTPPWIVQAQRAGLG